MKKILVSLILLFFLPWPTVARGSERILDYGAYIGIKPAGDMDVTERITVVCEGDRIKHGIYRDFPTRYKDGYGNTVRVAFEVRDIRRDGHEEPWHTEDRGNGVRLYIGSKDAFLEPGEYAYTITYRTDRQLGFFTDHDELYWNVTGNGWEFPIEKAKATVELPPGARILSTSAYTGLPGDRGADFTAGIDGEGRAVFNTTRMLGPREGLTVVAMWPKGFVREPTKGQKAKAFLSDNGSAFAGTAGIAVLLAYYVLAWIKVGRDPEKGVVIPLFEAPKGFSPDAVRYVMRMGFDDKAFAAAVVNMAVKGFITIKEDEGGEYSLVKNGSDETALSATEKKIAQEFFSGSRDTVLIKKGNHETIRKAMDAVRKSLAVQYEKIYFFTNSATLVPGLLISALGIAAAVFRGGNKADAGFMALWLTIWTCGCAVLLYRVFDAWKKALKSDGQKAAGLGGAFMLSLFALPFLGGEGLAIWMFSSVIPPFAILCILLIILFNALFYQLMKAPTFKGRRIMDQIEGLKLYLSVAEKDRLNLLNPPENTPEIFERFLPYALALDVEQEWCERFNDILNKARIENAYSPRWYTGNRFHALGMSGLASGLGAMSSSISSSSSPPGSRSGGRGSSGGGGGGGGGGGW